MEYTKQRQELAAKLLKKYGTDRIYAAAGGMLRDRKVEKDPAVNELIENGGSINLLSEEIVAFMESLDEEGVRAVGKMLNVLANLRLSQSTDAPRERQAIQWNCRGHRRRRPFSLPICGEAIERE
jgi:hypothetical protein